MPSPKFPNAVNAIRHVLTTKGHTAVRFMTSEHRDNPPVFLVTPLPSAGESAAERTDRVRVQVVASQTSELLDLLDELSESLRGHHDTVSGFIDAIEPEVTPYPQPTEDGLTVQGDSIFRVISRLQTL